MTTRQNGMTLVEILVAVAIGMIGIVIITQAYLTSDNFNRSTLGESGAQTNGLIGLYTIERDVRNAGYGIADSAALGCGEIYWYLDPDYSSNVTPGSTLPKISLAPVLIGTDTTAPFTDPDTLTVMFANGANRMLPGTIKGFNAKSSEIEMDQTTGFQDNDLVLLVNGTGCTLAKITHVQPGPIKLQVNPGQSAPYNPPAWGLFPTNYGTGDLLVNLGNPVVRMYMVEDQRLKVADALFQNPTATRMDLMDGIVDLRAQYGKDNGVNNGTVSAAFYTPNDARVDQFSNVTPANSAEWQQVLTVRVGILARIGSYERPTAPGGNCDATTTQPRWSGGTFDAVDIATLTSQDRCYRYRVFETTIPLRNMVWRAT
jgi:type IV pilus assembly protein PilW